MGTFRGSSVPGSGSAAAAQAENVSITDSGNNFTSENVEAALAEEADARQAHEADLANPHSVTPAQLSLEIGTDVQAWNDNLDDLAALTPTNGNVIVGDGADWTAESGSTARASLGAAAKASATTEDNITTFDANDEVQDGGASIAQVVSRGQRKNLIINGSFDIWQRGTSFTLSSSGDYGPDRFNTRNNTAGVAAIDRSTTVPTVAQAGQLLNYSAKVTVSTADASMGASDQMLVQQRIEGYNYRQIAGKTATLSFWVRSSLTGTYTVAFRNSGSDRVYVSEYTVDVANTWERKSVTLPFNEQAGTWDYTTGIGVEVTWTLAAGSGQHAASTDTWLSDSKRSTSNQVNLLSSTSNDWHITGIQIEAGDTATDLEFIHYTDELARCQRYYLELDEYRVTGNRTASVQYSMYCVFPTVMRAAPTITTANFVDVDTSGRTISSFATKEWGINSITFDAGTGVDTSRFTFDVQASAEL